jgi:hypothetical protein
MSLPRRHQNSTNVVFFSDAVYNEINKTHFQRAGLNMLIIFRKISNSDIEKHINTVEYPGTVQ